MSVDEESDSTLRYSLRTEDTLCKSMQLQLDRHRSPIMGLDRHVSQVKTRGAINSCTLLHCALSNGGLP